MHEQVCRDSKTKSMLTPPQIHQSSRYSQAPDWRTPATAMRAMNCRAGSTERQPFVIIIIIIDTCARWLCGRRPPDTLAEPGWVLSWLTRILFLWRIKTSRSSKGRFLRQNESGTLAVRHGFEP